MKALAESGMAGGPSPGSVEDDPLTPLALRVDRILGLTENARKQNGRMLFFVMYDIESNKVRNCTRIQKSIFLAESPVATYNRIKDDLAEVQAAYDNQDSIIVLPVTTDYLRMMKIIGKTINVDVITKTQNTIFF